jgi:hypothetical protein
VERTHCKPGGCNEQGLQGTPSISSGENVMNFKTHFKTLIVLFLALQSVQAKAGFTATECHNCQDAQLS